MPETRLSVTLLAVTPDALSLIYAAFRQCYHPGYVADMWPRLVAGEIAREKQAEFVARILASGHESPIEHVSFTFAVSGVSRALSHQLVRHRIASYSQQSQRYVRAKNFDYVTPPSILKGGPHENYQGETANTFYDIMRRIEDAYDDILSLGIPAEDARFVLPNACETKIVVTMNCRSLLHFFEQRCCMRAQWEIRAMATEMLALCRQTLPVVFEGAGARCERMGYCPEDEKFSCGRYPRRDENV